MLSVKELLYLALDGHTGTKRVHVPEINMEFVFFAGTWLVVNDLIVVNQRLPISIYSIEQLKQMARNNGHRNL